MRTVLTQVAGPVTIDHVQIEVRRALKQKLEYIADNLQIHIQASLNEKIQFLMDEIERLRTLNGSLLGKADKLERRNQKLEKALGLQAEYRRLIEEILNARSNGEAKENSQPQLPAQPSSEIGPLIWSLVQKLMQREGLPIVEDREVRELIGRLEIRDPRMCKMLVMRFDEKQTFRTIAKKFGISTARARQIVMRACQILKFGIEENEKQNEDHTHA